VLIALRQRSAFVAALGSRRLPAVLLHGVFVMGGAVLLMHAITMVPASYVNSVRRMGAVFSVVLGSMLFDEPGLGDRLRGAVMACAGAALLLLG
jgi:hypothetical protein